MQDPALEQRLQLGIDRGDAQRLHRLLERRAAQLAPAQVALDSVERAAVLLDRGIQVGALLAGDRRLLRLPQPLPGLDQRPHL